MSQTALERLIAEAEREGSSTSPLIAAARAEREELVAFIEECASDRDDRVSPGIKAAASAILAKHATAPAGT